MSQSNSDIKKSLIAEYGYICMAGGEIEKNNPLTMHHIKRRADHGKTNVENGSNIAYLEHSGIHVLGDRSIKKYKTISDYLQEYKELRDEVMRSQFHMWLVDELKKAGVKPQYTKSKLLIYKK